MDLIARYLRTGAASGDGPRREHKSPVGPVESPRGFKESLYMYVCMYVCMYACMHACLHVCMHVCMYVYRYIYIYICIYIYVYTYICIYTYIHIYIYVLTPLMDPPFCVLDELEGAADDRKCYWRRGI